MRLICIFFFFIILPTSYCLGQSWEVELSGGATGYIGDINPVRVYKVTDPAFGIGLKRNFDGTWSAGINIMQGRIQGNDANSNNSYQRTRNLNFHSPLTELSSQVEFNFFNYLPGIQYAIDHHKITPFLFVGVGVVFFSPQTIYQGTEYQLQSYATEGVSYPLYSLTIPYGVGVKYHIRRNWSAVFKVGYRIAFTDYLDDVSGRYSASSTNNPIGIALQDRSGEINGGHFIGVPGTQRGDFRERDTYMFVSFGISYALVSHKCFKF